MWFCFPSNPRIYPIHLNYLALVDIIFQHFLNEKTIQYVYFILTYIYCDWKKEIYRFITMKLIDLLYLWCNRNGKFTKKKANYCVSLFWFINWMDKSTSGQFVNLKCKVDIYKLFAYLHRYSQYLFVFVLGLITVNRNDKQSNCGFFLHLISRLNQ